ncbi:heme biosynthesis HemY N-terminal domain-containing protein [Gilvimarinus algae]|uniref:Heme biosynthesis HemY N-terminal domain-containing protein n=1 Tax=Gilvimarinus algae TaxID=3058037 RepID=A0ABT8TGA6_9GAMM|nr:heme biosynthesis HemY N-terminal domain-containing protein [Gilvimarinus sp. SDUM040014]MDO3383122.1 heme biosynthesis HemY N-terminal domain-containing protein [Gilvimarinus sp. SDUM040014]
MKRRLILLLVFMLAGALLYQLMRSDSGYVLLAYGATTVEMSLWTGLALWLLGFVIFYFLWRLFRGGRKVGKLLTGERRLSPRAQSRTMAALVDFIEGNWQVARKQLVKSAGKSVNPLVNYLAAARCSYELGDFPGALDLLHKAEKSRGSSELAVALTQARMQLGSKRFEQCLATLKRIKRLAPEHPVVLDLLADVYWALDDIDALEELLPALRELNVRSGEGLKKLQIDVYLRQLQLVEKRHQKQPDAAACKQALDDIWARIPASLHKEPELMAGFAAALHRLGCDEQAEPLLTQALQKHWQDEWVALYGLVQGSDPKTQLKIANTWLRQHDADATLLATLGRLCVRNQLWGKARDYFSESLDMLPAADVYADLARLLDQLGESEASARCYREGLEHAARERQARVQTL